MPCGQCPTVNGKCSVVDESDISIYLYYGGKAKETLKTDVNVSLTL